MTDKQFLQRMRKMVKDTHWIKGSLKRILEFEKDPDRSEFCKLDDNNQMIPGKYGHCLVGIIGVVGEVPFNDDPRKTEDILEYRLGTFKQTTRIVDRLIKNLPEDWVNPEYEYNDSPDPAENTMHKAYRLESFNDDYDTEKEKILALLDRSIDNK